MARTAARPADQDRPPAAALHGFAGASVPHELAVVRRLRHEEDALPVVSAEVVVPVDPETAFAVSQTTGAVRRRWDRFISEQHFLDGAESAGKDVRTFTRQRFGFAMVSRYVSYAPPTNVGMVMEDGPWFFAKLGGGWRFTEVPGGTLAVWKYNFACRPAWIAPLADWIGERVLGFEIRRRIDGFAAGCADPDVLAAIRR